MKPITPSSRVDGVKYAIRDVVLWVQEAREAGRKILSLNIGDPCQYDFDIPQHIKDAVCRAMAEGRNGYSPSHGIEEAVEAIRNEAETLYGMKNVSNIFVTTGGSEAIDICLTALLEEGDNVLVPAPGYPLYTAVIGKLRARENFYYLDEEDGWQPNIDDIVRRINNRTRAIVIINPNNPTGAVYTKEKLLEIAEVAREYNLLIMADEIYSKLILDDLPHHSIAALAPDQPVVTFNGLSKNYMAPGWRLGWAIVTGEPELVDIFNEAANKLVRARLCANHPEQYGIRAALEGPHDHIKEASVKLRERRDLTFKRMNEIPHLSCVKPLGAFYAFPSLDIDHSDADWVRSLLLETGVLTVHGEGFGEVEGTRHFRIVFLPEMETLQRSYDKIEQYMEKHYG
jgi:alanine-synthesizing transaminase